MDLKPFLRPTRAKLLLAALLYLLFVPIVQYCILYGSTLEFQQGNMDPGSGFQGCKYISLLETFFNLHSFSNPNWLFAFAGIPISYLAACLLVLPFQKPERKS